MFSKGGSKLGQTSTDFKAKRRKSARTLQSHLLKARGGHQRGKARRPSVRPRQIGVWQQCAPDWQASKTPSCQDSACRYDGAHSEKPTKRASAGPVCSLDGRVVRPTGPMKRNEERVANQSNHVRELGSRCTSPSGDTLDHVDARRAVFDQRRPARPSQLFNGMQRSGHWQGTRRFLLSLRSWRCGDLSSQQ
jgi:hypothetical protein